MSVVLDASALLAVLLNEQGIDVVLPVLRQSHMSAVNLSEVFVKLLEKGVDISRAQAQIDRFEIRIFAFDERHALHAASLRPLTKHLGLSFGDRACLAQAHLDKMPVFTADKDWSKLNLDSVIWQIR